MTDTVTPVADTPSLDASGLLRWAHLCVERLGQHREELNGLNVFPVPDSDTGTNLLHTMRAAVEQAEGEAAWIAGGEGVPGAREIAVRLGRGAVHGARGNSGVILSQVLRAIGEAATFTVVDSVTLRRALRTAVRLVEHALSDPVEGTIVSVLDAAARAATDSTATRLDELTRVVADAAAVALEKTPSQLAVLREAGVVDAGGRGLLVLFDSLVEVLTGVAPGRPEYSPAEPVAGAAGHADSPADGESRTRFEVMYSLGGTDEGRVDELRGELRDLGDSVVVVGDGGSGISASWTVHVHTDEIGAALEAGLAAGRPSEIRVTDLLGTASGSDDDPACAGPAAGRSVVAVAPPGPLSDLFVSAGAAVVDSDEDSDVVVERILAIEGAELVVLPNGALGRSQIVSIDAGIRDRGRHVIIVPTSSAVQGLAALAVHDPGTSLSLDGFAMADAASGTRHAHIVTAEQDALTLVGQCRAGDYLGILGHDVAVIGTDPAESVRLLVDRLLSSGGELVTMLFGDPFDEERLGEVIRSIEGAHPDVEVVGFHVGGSGVTARIGVE